MTEISNLDGPAQGLGQQVLPVRMWIDWDGTPVLFQPVIATFEVTHPNAVAASSARVQTTADAVLLHQIALADGQPFPYAVGLRPDETLAPAVRADARDGNPNLFVRPVYVNETAGSGKLLVYLLPALDASGGWFGPGELMSTLLELDDGDADGELEIEIAPSVPGIAVSAPAPVHVGRRFDLPFTISLPGPETLGMQGLRWQTHPGFASDGDFRAALGALAGPAVYLAIEEPSTQFVDRWGASGDTRIPYALLVRSLASDDGDDPPLRLIEPARLAAKGSYAGYERFRFAQGLGEYLVARRPGSGTVSIGTPYLFATGIEPTEATVAVEIQPVTLVLTLTSEDASAGTIVLEDRWLEDEGVLVGGFRARVSVPQAATPPGELSLVYDSDARPAYISASVSPGEILLKVVVEEAEDPSLFGPFGDNVLRSFRIRATVEDTSVAQFWFPPDAILAGAQADLIGDLRSVLRAVGPGTTRVKVELLPVPEPLPEECVQYEMPTPRELDVFVPEPLEAALESWIDPYFTGDNELAFGRPEREVIYANGTLTGRVRNHRPASQSERVTLAITRPDGQELVYDMDGGTLTVDAGGGIRQAVGELARSMGNGENRVRLSAWKPINEVVGDGESVAEEVLDAVLPVEPTLEFASEPGDGQRIVRRTLPDVAWSLALATSGDLYDDAPSSGLASLDTVSGVSYERRTVTTAQPRLPAEVGTHEILAVARNDFGSAEATRTLTAVRPEVNVDLSVPAGYAGRYRSPDRVGNSVQRVTADVTVRYAIQLAAAGPGLHETSSISLPFENRGFTFDLPEPPEELAVGDNVFRFTGTNEFGSRERAPTIRRRGRVYDFDSVSVELRCLEENRYIRADVLLDGELIDHVEQSFRVLWTQGATVESPSALGFDMVSFEIREQDEDGDLHPADSALLLDLRTTGLVGPDFEDLLGVILLPGSQVVDDPANVPVGNGMWLTVVREAGEDGDIPVDFVEP